MRQRLISDLVATYINLRAAQQQLNITELALTEAVRDHHLSVVSLFYALGGSW